MSSESKSSGLRVLEFVIFVFCASYLPYLLYLVDQHSSYFTTIANGTAGAGLGGIVFALLLLKPKSINCSNSSFSNHVTSRQDIRPVILRCLRFGFFIALPVVLSANNSAHADGIDLAKRELIKGTVLIRNTKEKSRGTGVVIDDNLVVTNAHVVGDSRIVKVVCPVFDLSSDRQAYKVKRGRGLYGAESEIQGVVVSVHNDVDLAFVEVFLPKEKQMSPIKMSLLPNLYDLPDAEVWKDRGVAKGDKLYFLGHPATRPRWSFGIGEFDSYDEGFEVGDYERRGAFARYHGPVWYGNSGGALVNEQGLLIGLISAGSENINLAVATSEIRKRRARLRFVPMAIANKLNYPVRFRYRWGPDHAWNHRTLAPSGQIRGFRWESCYFPLRSKSIKLSGRTLGLNCRSSCR